MIMRVSAGKKIIKKQDQFIFNTKSGYIIFLNYHEFIEGHQHIMRTIFAIIVDKFIF